MQLLLMSKLNRGHNLCALLDRIKELMSSRLRKFLSYYKPYRGLLAADLICASIVSAITLTLPLCARVITDSITTLGVNEAIASILQIGSLMIGLVLVHAICLFFIDYKGHLMGAYMERDLRSDLFAHLQRMSIGFYDDHKVGQLMTRITSDTVNLSELYHHGPEDIVITLIKFVGTFVILVNINVDLTLIIFACLPPMVVYAFHFNKKMNVALRESRDRIGDVNAQIEDSLGGIRVIASFTNEGFEQEKFGKENQRFLEARRIGYKSEAYLYCGIVAFTQIFTVIVIGVGGYYIVDGPLSIADLITFLLYVGLLVEPIRTALNFARLYQYGITGFDRVMDLLEIEPEIMSCDNAVAMASGRGIIEFDDVSFKYRSGSSDVFSSLSLKIQAGEFVALVGPSGIGKSTLCALIPRFYDIDKGVIRLDQVDIRDVDLSSLRKQIAVVQQDVYLFDGTVAENILYGRLDATLEEMVDAAKDANAHDFIMSLIDGYQTQIGQRGVKLSGGQKQRLSIARAFLKKPSILIFDEATSALDNESEQAIRNSLEKLSRNSTTIVIAHRLSTIQNADRILVLAEDGITEQGAHNELLAAEGTYARLYSMQASL
jgi:ATP-binding cassette subfamily B protein